MTSVARALEVGETRGFIEAIIDETPIYFRVRRCSESKAVRS
jgi:hypothetical protein